MAPFADRTSAGQQLARELLYYAGREDVVILGLPRGGVPVAFEVAKALKAPLDVFVVRKLGVPGNPELAMGAIASGGVRVLNEDVVRTLGISEQDIERVTAIEHEELERREKSYRGARPEVDVKDKTVILVDDGLATGATMRAAVNALRERDPERIVVAVPTAPPETCAEFEDVADEIICLITPRPFFGVGGSYRDFSQTSDERVRALLDEADAFSS
ncbi:MAG: phosphoribosyltransferase [Chloroflexota bacterium]|nr:phosphoribosyltransferase [Chloroflexota bacterium]